MGSTIADGLAHPLVVRRLQPILQIALQPSCARFLVLADGRMIFGNGLLLFLILSFCETSNPTYCFIAPPIRVIACRLEDSGPFVPRAPTAIMSSCGVRTPIGVPST